MSSVVEVRKTIQKRPFKRHPFFAKGKSWYDKNEVDAWLDELDQKLDGLGKTAKTWWDIDEFFALDDEKCRTIEGCEDGKGCWLTNPECPRNKKMWVRWDDDKP